MDTVVTIVEKEIVKDENETLVNGDIYKDCFIALSLAILREPWMNSDLKAIAFMSMLRILKEKGYSDEQVETIRVKLSEIKKNFMTKNDFMG